MRLNRFLASCGLGSRRACEQLVHDGRVFLNGREVRDLATRVEATDEVIVDGKPVQTASAITLVLNKPRGFLCTRADEQVEARETIYELLPAHFRSLHYVGRLDMDSEGLLILTNSGELTERLTHPRFGIEKEYLVALDHVFQAEAHGPVLEQGFPIEGGFAKATAIAPIEPRVVALTLTQGIKRQIRLMFEALGYKVNRLERVRIGALTLPDLKSGRWRVLSASEIAKLLETPRPPKPRRVEKTTSRPARPTSPPRRTPSSKGAAPRHGARDDKPEFRGPRRAAPSSGSSKAPPRRASQGRPSRGFRRS